MISDSMYTLDLAAGKSNPTANKELAQELRQLAIKYRVKTRHVRGHLYKKSIPWQEQERDVVLNERCDRLAKYGKEKNKPKAEEVLS